MSEDEKKPAGQGGQQECSNKESIDRNPGNVNLAERGRATLSRVLMAMPDLVDELDTAFQVRLATGKLTSSDLEALARVQAESDTLQRDLIDSAIARHLKEGHDAMTARRLAAAEFGTMFACAVDFVVRGAGHE